MNLGRTELTDQAAAMPVLESNPAFAGRIWDVRSDRVELPHGEHVVRDVVIHPGAVGIIALDESDRVLLVRQYRHPVGMYLWEPPAGLLDIAGEPPWRTAARELAEETGLAARKWWLLADWFNSPGGSSEAFRCYLARDLYPAPGGRPERDAEEHDMPLAWVPLDEAVAAVRAGHLHNPVTVAGLLAAYAAREEQWSGLRPVDSPWPAYEHLRDTGRLPRPDPPPDREP